MTSVFSTSTNPSSEPFDIGPLSWVMGEVREAITTAGKLLSDAITQDVETRSTTLLHAKSYLHQAHGALQIVDIDGVSIVTETIEDTIDRIQSGQLELTAHVITVLTDAFHAILRYLEGLLSGAAHQPVRLFPYYRALLELKGAERIHPADLFFPSLSVQEAIPELALSGGVVAINYAALRQVFERLLLTVLTSKDSHAQLAAVQKMHDVIQDIEHAQSSKQAKAFWLVMRGFAEAVASGSIENQQYVKQIFARINLQIRRLVDGVTNIPERLLRDALFFIAQVEQPSPFVAQIRKAYQLGDQVPLDYDQKGFEQIVVGILTTAKDQLSNAKNLWGRIANGDLKQSDKFSQKMKDLAETGVQLNSPPLTKLLRELSGIANHAVHAGDINVLGLEVATALLFVESALDQIARLPAHFSERADEISARLLSLVSGEIPQAQAAWMGEISREAQQRQTMAVLVNEMQSSLRQVEKNLDEFFRDPGNKETLASVLPVLHQVGGALAILDQDDAMLAVEHTRDLVRTFVEDESADDSEDRSIDFNNVAQNIGALTFFIETLQSQPDAVKKKFVFDPEAKLLRSNLLDKTVDKELLPTGSLINNASVNADHIEPVVFTAEQELLEHQQESARLAASLVDAPEDMSLQAQLKDSLESQRSVANLLDDTDAGARAKAAIDLLDSSESTHSAEVLTNIVAATASQASPSLVLQETDLPEGDEAIDAELLDIFLTEADEVLAFVRQTIPLSRVEPSNQEYLTSLRRSFHTLKGSGRMVGLNVFGEAAWSIEQVMNVWLSESRDGTESLYALLDQAGTELFDWVEDLKNFGASRKNGLALIDAAERIKNGESYQYFEESAPPVEVFEQAVASDESTPAEQSHQPVIFDVLATDNSDIDSTIPALVELVSDEQFDATVTDDLYAGGTVSEDNAIEVASFTTEPTTGFSDSDVRYEVADLPAADEQPEIYAVSQLASNELLSNEFVESVDTAEADAPITTFEVDSPSDTFGLDSTTLDPFSSHEPNNVLTDVDVAEDAAHLEDSVSVEYDAAPEEILSDAVRSSAQIIEFPDQSLFQPPQDDGVKVIGEIEVSTPLHTIYMAETDEIVRFLTQDFSEWRHEPHRAVTRHAVHAAHSLAGSSATVGLIPLQELAHALESVLQRLERHPVILDNAEFDVLDQSVHIAKEMLKKFALSEMAEKEPDDVQLLENLLQAVISRSAAGEDEDLITSTNEKLDLAYSEEDLGLDLPAALQNDEIDEVNTDLISASVDSVVQPITDDDQLEEAHSPDVALAVDGPSSAEFLPDVATEEEPLHPINELAENNLSTDFHTPQFAQDVSNNSEQEHAWSQAPSEPEAVSYSLPQAVDNGLDLQVRSVASVASQDDHGDLGQRFDSNAMGMNPEHRVKDDLDQDLLPVFLEEGRDLLPMVGQLLRSWQSQPDDRSIPQSILRLMHTIKGSARMAGAMELGQHTHDLETRIENLMHTGGAVRQTLLDDLQSRHDYSMQLFDRLQNPDVAQVIDVPLLTSQEDMSQLDASQNQASGAAYEPSQSVNIAPLFPVESDSKEFLPSTRVAPAAPTPAVASNAPLVRVRADILDRLVNQAGEVSISRSRLENEVGTLRSSLSELTDNVNRLRDQLREVEIQAETQITSRMAHSADREFDPLEFDRFTRLQELTRMMAESVSDVATVQSNLNRTLDGASNDLHMQARLTRDLQQDLMRVRMIPFASISERLYRVTRQTAKEVDKRVNLDIRGTSVEIDRSVLEKMTGPFEHLLRNAIVHGIESRDDRRANGKQEIGEMLIEIRQEGNEVVIRFQDDGQGINLGRVREKANTAGLLSFEQEISDAEVVNLIFEPGFSTASEVTELAGRGVGMDVVRSEAASLGGRVEVQSQVGKGAQFTIRLPLTLAVTQVVVLSSGGKTYAVPSVLVEQVQRLKASTLAAAYNDGSVQWQGARVPLYFLSGLLGERDVTPVTQHSSPLLIMKSGTDRVAIHVDDILGNREVVVKNIGPQLARMAGISGATVLGSGEVVLILNPVPLAQRVEHEYLRHPQAHETGVSQDMGAVAELVNQGLDVNSESKSGSGQTVTAQPIQGLRTQHIVMVVDDSLTVRRVTQRLLVREGYQVALAKDGIDALEQLQSITPDVMLVDIEMPRMDGFDLTRNIRSDARTNHIPIIMITSRTADKHRNYAHELGVNAYFGKPYPEEALLESIAQFVSTVPVL